MSRYLPYHPEQAYLLPPSIAEELGEDHLALFLHRAVERLDLSSFYAAYSAEGGALYHPALLLKVWLYAYGLGITSSRRLEQRIREDLGFRYLAGGAKPDFWALNRFRRQHARGINDVFVQVLEMARRLGLGRLGTVAIDSTRIRGCASRDRIDSEERLRKERARLRRRVRQWQKACDADDPQEGAGLGLGPAAERLEQELEQMPGRLERLRKSGLPKLSRSDADSRFLRERGGFVLGYTAEVAVAEDHLIVAARVTQNATDQPALLPMVEAIEQSCGTPPQRVLADSGFFCLENVRALEARGIDPYVPDANLAAELNRGRRCTRQTPARDPLHRRLRRKLRSPAGRALYRRRKALVEPVFGVLKEQRGLRRFRLRGLEKVNLELRWAAVAYNLTRMFNHSG